MRSKQRKRKAKGNIGEFTFSDVPVNQEHDTFMAVNRKRYISRNEKQQDVKHQAAPKRRTKGSRRNAPPTFGPRARFIYFSKLPKELRLRVWEFAMEITDLRIITEEGLCFDLESKDTTKLVISSGLSDFFPRVTRAMPALFDANYESRMVVKADSDYRFAELDLGYLKRGIPFYSGKDILAYIPSARSFRIAEELYPKIQHLAIVSTDLHILAEDIEEMENLVNVFIFCFDYYSDFYEDGRQKLVAHIQKLPHNRIVKLHEIPVLWVSEIKWRPWFNKILLQETS